MYMCYVTIKYLNDLHVQLLKVYCLYRVWRLTILVSLKLLEMEEKSSMSFGLHLLL